MCETCKRGPKECDGHLGHISLPLPVFNPVFIRHMFQLLKMCCFHCKRFVVSPVGLEVFMTQLLALDMGLVHLFDELEAEAAEILHNCNDRVTMDTAFYIRNILQTRIKEACGKNSPAALPEQVRSSVEKKQAVIKSFLQGSLLKPSKSCHHCASKRGGVTIVNNSLIIVNSAKRDLRKSEDDGKSTIVTTVKSYLTATEARQTMRDFWQNENHYLSRMFGLLQVPSGQEVEHPTDVFFLDVVPVPPNKFRPLRYMNGRTFENEHTACLSELMMAANVLAMTVKKSLSDDAEGSTGSKGSEATKIHYAWQRLQIMCNRLYDSDMDRLNDKKYQGIKQLIEKKEGLFRKHMMGKRVNFAARSVISPDPYIMADEVGIPKIFATKLSYPQPVTAFNIDEMRKAILNGPNVHPGALAVSFNNTTMTRLKADDPTQRLAIADKIEVLLHRGKVPVVHRHLISGDVMLLNRQPTLHKPSIMAHRALVLPREKTLRMHYANCKCYNADFDGDEMNAHFPQSELSRAEAYNIASVNYQYLVPKDGTPLSGLIQDHIVGATLLSLRGMFLNREDFQELIYGALSFTNKTIVFPPPALQKPFNIWTGKQVITTLVLNLIPSGKPPPTVSIPSKVKPKSFVSADACRSWTDTQYGTQLKADEMCESQTIIRHGELLCGIIDKASIGPTHYGLVHVCYELYGGETSSAMLTAFARLATNFLQSHQALTLGIHDILVKDDANRIRRKAMKKAEKIGTIAVCDAIGITAEEFFNDEFRVEKMRQAHVHKDPLYMKQLDHSYKQQTDRINNDISGACLGSGLVKQFPANNLQLMIQAGAKGGTVNALQISCLLGQIELEGRRPPLMMSGKSLPSFEPYNSTPRAGGFISGRFLTGIRPQEFFFHCMAGREGLIDTAVKTSRSGYLQRCLIKHLEGLMVNYDLTVRDSDGSVIQFQYGEDGLDILKSQLLDKKAIPTLISNIPALKPSEDETKRLNRSTDSKAVAKHKRAIRKWEQHNQTTMRSRSIRGSAFLDFYDAEMEELTKTDNEGLTTKQLANKICMKWFKMTADEKRSLNKYWLPCPDPLPHVFPAKNNFGVLSERLDMLIENYINENPHKLLEVSPKVDEDAMDVSYKHSKKEKRKSNKSKDDKATPEQFKEVVSTRFIKALCDPGEAVGLVAAQSIGEPSTQMTLNTFHFAGRGEMNVTLGIPRLREILMTASPSISTPSMDLPLRADLGDDAEMRAEQVRLMLNSVKLADVLQDVGVDEQLIITDDDSSRTYTLKFTFLPRKYYRKKYNVNAAKVLQFFESKFIVTLLDAIKRKMKTLLQTNSLFDHSVKVEKVKTTVVDFGDDDGDGVEQQEQAQQERKLSKKRAMKAFADEDEVSSDEEQEVDGDTTDKKSRERRNQELDYEEPEDEEIERNASDNEVEEMESTARTAVEDLDETTNDAADETEQDQTIDESMTEMSAGRKRRLERQEQLQYASDGRISKVKGISPFIVDYEFDTKKEEWCTLKLKYAIAGSKFDIASVIETEARKAYVYKVGKIDRAFLVKDMDAANRGGYNKMIKTEGVSFLSMVDYCDVLDLNRMYSNDIHAIANTYGIEAAAKALKREISNVFAVYGIQVDSRHLSLISDYMTFGGTIKGMNRGAMSSNSSPIQQMTFETTTAFLKTAALIGKQCTLL